jgi:hypothetical protein
MSLLELRIIKWVCARLSSEDGRLRLAFEGGYLGYLGWRAFLATAQ